jgi:hypothetical protein
VFTWSKYVRRVSISAALASRICSSKLAKLCALIFVAASCSSSSFLTRLEQSVHWESNSSRSGHLSAISQPFSHAPSLQGASTCVTLAQGLVPEIELHCPGRVPPSFIQPLRLLQDLWITLRPDQGILSRPALALARRPDRINVLRPDRGSASHVRVA